MATQILVNYLSALLAVANQIWISTAQNNRIWPTCFTELDTLLHHRWPLYSQYAGNNNDASLLNHNRLPTITNCMHQTYLIFFHVQHTLAKTQRATSIPQKSSICCTPTPDSMAAQFCLRPASTRTQNSSHNTQSSTRFLACSRKLHVDFPGSAEFHVPAKS